MASDNHCTLRLETLSPHILPQGILVVGLLCTPIHSIVFGQTAGIRLRFDDMDNVVAAEYSGRAGKLYRARLEQYPHLDSLDVVWGTSLTPVDIHMLGRLTTLRELQLGQCDGFADESVAVLGSLDPLARLTELQSVVLNIGNTSDQDFEFLSSLPNLEYLEVSLFRETDPSYVDSVTDQCAKSLAKIKSLRSLVVRGDGQDFSDRFIDELTLANPNLVHLEISSEHLTDKTLNCIGSRLKNLQWLEIHSNAFSNDGVAELRRLTELEHLDISSTQLTKGYIPHLKSMKKLRFLDIPIDEIGDGTLRVIADFPQLEVLAMRRPILTDRQFSMLRDHTSLECVYLNGEGLSAGVVVDTIRTMPRLHHMGISRNKSLSAKVASVLEERQGTP